MDCTPVLKLDDNENGSKEVHIEAPTSMIILSQAECIQVLWMPHTPVLKLDSDDQTNSDGDRNSSKGWIWKPTYTGDYPAM